MYLKKLKEFPQKHTVSSFVEIPSIFSNTGQFICTFCQVIVIFYSLIQMTSVETSDCVYIQSMQHLLFAHHFYRLVTIQQENWVNFCNGFAMSTAP